ncbi:MAG: methylmalonyl-CoA mutase family protein [Bryobacteraceae bacterium]|jgi:methylmalonyl-CoA mutase
MPDSTPEAVPGTEILSLAQDFPPIAAADWDRAVRADLKGADYDKKLVWRTDEGLAVRPYCRREDLAGLESQTQAAPGEFPFVRGSGKAWQAANGASFSETAIRADQWHDGGAHAVQELAWAVAAGVERVAERPAGQPVDDATRSIEFVFAVGSAYFVEIAKLRAARLLWARAVEAFQPASPAACLMRLSVRTGRLNKSIFDPYANLLRATTEALSAVIGGCDSLEVEAFGFGAHLAENVHHVLREEAHMGEVADPAGGSYYIETLTDALARAGWTLFQQIEAAGGYRAAAESGALSKALAETRAGREKAVSSRRRTLVGVNNYPDLNEKTSDVKPPAASENTAPRLAAPFEKIRQRTARHAAAAGRYPKLLLLARGDVKMRGARANFMLNFFGCAGFDIEQSSDYAGTDANLIALCSSDAEYLELAREVCPAAKVPVIVAGNPKDQIEALTQAGVAGFVHVQSDAVGTLTDWQNRLGMTE